MHRRLNYFRCTNGLNGKPISDFLLVINCNFSRIPFFEIFTLKDEKTADFTTPSLFDAPARGNPLEFLDETYPANTRGMGLPYGETFIILTSTVFV